MKRLFAVVCCLVMVCMLGACSQKVNQEELAPFIGSWDCQETTMEEHGKEDAAYVGYLELRVEEDGAFRMYDVEAGNPGMCGNLYPEGGVTQFVCDENEDFDPPYSWIEMGIQPEGELSYAFVEENGAQILKLSFINGDGEASTLVFDKME